MARIWHTAGPEAAYQELGNYISLQQLGRFKDCEPRRVATQFLYMLLNDIHLQLMLGLVSPPSSEEINTLVFEVSVFGDADLSSTGSPLFKPIFTI